MKKYLLLLLLTLPLVFAACSKDKDDEDDSHDSRLVGTWYCSEYIGSSWNSYIGYRFEANGKCYYDEWKKNASPKLDEWRDNMRWKTSGNKLTTTSIFDDGEKEVLVYTYSVSKDENTLKLTDEDGELNTYTKVE